MKQRKIKFRAWNIATKTMVDLKKITPFLLNKDIGGLYIPESDEIYIMQYTGLKDKNGKELYESDYINIFDSDGRNYGKGPITFVKGGFQCYDMPLQDIYYENCKFEVIGNVFENPELLKQ